MGLINQAGLFSGAGLVDQAGLYNEAGLYVPGSFSPLSLNPLLAYEAESSMLAAGGGAAAQGDGISTLDDLTANSIDATQTTANHQPIAYDAANGGPFARFDGSDDRMSFTLASPITNGTVFFATQKGSYAANLDLAAGTHDFSGNKIANQYGFANDLVALYLFDYALTESQISQLKSYFVTKGAVEDYGAVTNFVSAWQDCSALTSFPADAKLGTEASNVNFTSAWRDSGLTSFSTPLPTATNAYAAWYGCSSLESFSTDLPSATSVPQAWRNCSSLTSFSAELPLVTDASVAWNNCDSLTSFSTSLPLATNVSYAWANCDSLASFSSEMPSATDASYAWNNCQSLESFSSALPSVTSVYNSWLNCLSLESFSIELPSVISAREAWRGCSSLTDFSADVFTNWNPSSILSGVFNNTWDGCSSLTAQSVENILTSIDTSGQYATDTGASGGTALADPVIDIDYNGDPLSAATTTAITNLKGKGWGITINGTLQ